MNSGFEDAQPGPLGTYSDAARRCSDTVNTHVAAGSGGKWCAIRLSDGGSDNIAYDTRRDAVRHQLHETLCAYVKIPRDSMGVGEAASFLAYTRMVYDKLGGRLPDPEETHVQMPIAQEHLPVEITPYLNELFQRRN